MTPILVNIMQSITCKNERQADEKRVLRFGSPRIESKLTDDPSAIVHNGVDNKAAVEMLTTVDNGLKRCVRRSVCEAMASLGKRMFTG